MRYPLLLVLLLAGSSEAARAATWAAPPSSPDGKGSALFSEDGVVELTLRADLRDVLSDRGKEPSYRPAEVYDASTGSTFAVRVRTRGNFRLRRLDCDVPPLRIDFEDAAPPESPFAGQQKVKLVTHCRNRDEDFEQRLLVEYLIYRAYNLLTDLSFRVRLARITYEDTAGKLDSVTRYGFFIEDDDDLADRLDAKQLDDRRIHPEAADRTAVTRMALFQYMIGNTDWGMTSQHNVEVLYLEPNGPIVPVAYDFDWAGLVDAPYAVPDPMLRLDDVLQRKYMGYCRTDEEIEQAAGQFMALRDTVVSLFSPELLDRKRARRSVGYLGEFFQMAQDPRKLSRRIKFDCLRM